MASNIRMLSSSLKHGSSIPKSTWLSRRIHHRRQLRYPIEGGLGNFLPPAALKSAVEWQEGLLERLSDEVKGTAEESTTVTQTVINTSTLKERTLAFNYASLALNNSYFLDQLKPPSESAENHEHDISPGLENAINVQHGSLRQLKSSISAAALGMFSNGWIWFVTDQKGITGVLPTFGPSTLLVRSRTYMAADKGLILGDNTGVPIDANADPDSVIPPSAPTPRTQPPGTGSSSPTSGLSFSSSPRTPDALGPRFAHSGGNHRWEAVKSTVYDFGNKQEAIPTILNVGETLYPLFCIPVYEHSWMSAGYGVWGKEEWLKQFWSVVDWSQVSRSYMIAKGGKGAIVDGKIA